MICPGLDLFQWSWGGDGPGGMLARIGIMRFEELLERWEAGRLSHAEAAAAPGVSERTFRRWRGRHAEDGAAGLVDRRVGKPSPRRAPEEELQRMPKLHHEPYAGFAIRHFHDRLRRCHGYKLGYTTTRLWLQKSGAVAPAPKRGAHRRKRPRRPPRRPSGRRSCGHRIGRPAGGR